MINAVIPGYIEAHPNEFRSVNCALYARSALYTAVALAAICTLTITIASSALYLALLTATASIIVLKSSTINQDPLQSSKT